MKPTQPVVPNGNVGDILAASALVARGERRVRRIEDSDIPDYHSFGGGVN